MKPNRILLPIVAGALLLLLSSSLFAQVKIDVKTKWVEKREMTVAKQGVIAAIEAAPATSTAEFGEDYALWLKNLHRTKKGKDSVVLTLDLELREPSLMTEGKLLKKERLTLCYAQGVLDSLRGLEGMDVTIMSRRQGYEAWNRLIGTTVGGLIPKGGALVGPILTALLQEVNGGPKPEEICEAILIGDAVVRWLDNAMAGQS